MNKTDDLQREKRTQRQRRKGHTKKDHLMDLPDVSMRASVS